MEKAMAPHPSTLAWKIPWTEEPGRLQSMGSRRVGHDWATSLSLFIFMHWRRKWQPTPVFLPGESQGWGTLVGCRLWGSHRVRHDWSDLAATCKRINVHYSSCRVGKQKSKLSYRHAELREVEVKKITRNVQDCSLFSIFFVLRKGKEKTHSSFSFSLQQMLEWVAISYSRESSRSRDQIRISYMSCTGRQILYHCTSQEFQRRFTYM